MGCCGSKQSRSTEPVLNSRPYQPSPSSDGRPFTHRTHYRGCPTDDNQSSYYTEGSRCYRWRTTSAELFMRDLKPRAPTPASTNYSGFSAAMNQAPIAKSVSSYTLNKRYPDGKHKKGWSEPHPHDAVYTQWPSRLQHPRRR